MAHLSHVIFKVLQHGSATASIVRARGGGGGGKTRCICKGGGIKLIPSNQPFCREYGVLKQ